ncbi:MAG: DUF1385 domain-containing protein [Firmicutes bacterium]|nr:DUF1385 domain-containing protein [Bacillota bacterium]
MRQEVVIGGQAVIEGVMMRDARNRAVAVRQPDQRIVIDQAPIYFWTSRWRFRRLPLVRGMFALIEALVLGLQALSFSANAALQDEEEKISSREIGITLVVGIVLGLGIFVVAPTYLVRFVQSGIESPLLLNIIEGFFRQAVLLGYLLLIGRLGEMQRVLQYHGAEHKAVNCLEAGEPLTVETVRRHSRFHPRCGTSFLLLVVLIKVLLYTFFGWPVLWQRILLRLALLPVVAGAAYELIRLAARHRNRLTALITAPGVWLQHLTTREPDDDQIEVALAALSSLPKEGDAEGSRVVEIQAGTVGGLGVEKR